MLDSNFSRSLMMDGSMEELPKSVQMPKVDMEDISLADLVVLVKKANKRARKVI